MSAIGIDIGGTNIRAAEVFEDRINKRHQEKLVSTVSEKELLSQVIDMIKLLRNDSITHIGIGVPSIVDKNGVVYNVQNIPAWEEVPLGDIISGEFGIPVFINNDVNCAAVGEKYYGLGQDESDFITLNLGTGVAAGIFLNNQLVEGSNCGAGEFGMIPYLDKNFEYYCSGQFFINHFEVEGMTAFNGAKQGDVKCIEIYKNYGQHLGKAIEAILFSIDPSLIILTGSVAQGYSFFKDSLWETLNDFAYSPTIKNLKIKLSENNDIPLLGAAALNKLKL